MCFSRLLTASRSVKAYMDITNIPLLATVAVWFSFKRMKGHIVLVKVQQPSLHMTETGEWLLGGRWHTYIMFITCTWDMCAHDFLLHLATTQPPDDFGGLFPTMYSSTIQLHFRMTITCEITTQSSFPPPSSHAQVHCWQWKPEPWELDKVPHRHRCKIR